MSVCKAAMFFAVAALGLGGLGSATTGEPAAAKRCLERGGVAVPHASMGKGKAFRSSTVACDAVAELDRISDFELLDKAFSPLAPGREISVAWMKGRSRPFAIGTPVTGESVLSIGFNERCDAVVATALVRHGDPANVEQPVIEFLNSRPIIGWLEVPLGL